MSLINTKTKTPDAEQALNSAIEQTQKSAQASIMWSLISIAASAATIAKKLR